MYEKWSFTLREERKVQVFKNRVLKKVFRLKKDEVSEQIKMGLKETGWENGQWV